MGSEVVRVLDRYPKGNIESNDLANGQFTRGLGGDIARATSYRGSFESRPADGGRRGKMVTQVTEDTSPATDAATTEETPTEWTVMGYLAGDNNLNEEMVLTLQEILAAQERQTSQQQEESEAQEGEHLWPRVRILAQLDASGLGLPTQRYVFDTRNKPDEEKRYLKTYVDTTAIAYNATVNTGNPFALIGFVEWAVEETPDPGVQGSHMLILSGHGSGSTEDFLLKDESPADSLTIDELEFALKKARKHIDNKKFDLLGMDCCFMSMVEVCYQIRQYVDFVVGAESMVPDFGWPYHKILAAAEKLRQENGELPVTPEELAKIIVKEYIEFYSDYDRTAGRSVDLAAIRLVEQASESDESGSGPDDPVNLMDSLAASIKGLADALTTALSNKLFLEQIHLAHWEAQTYKFDQFADLRDVCLRIKDRFANLPSESGEQQEINDVIDACDAVIEELAKCVVLSGCSGFAYQYSYGLSIYFPWAKVSDAYQNLDFAKPVVTGWYAFLKEYVEKTRRDERDKGVADSEMEKSEDFDAAKIGQISAAIDAVASSIAGNPGKAKGLLKKTAGLADDGDLGDLHPGSRYHKSRYHKSRYHKSRWPGDREKSVKNFTPVVGTAYWPPQQNG
jgi:hypothetical protein